MVVTLEQSINKGAVYFEFTKHAVERFKERCNFVRTNAEAFPILENMIEKAIYIKSEWYLDKENAIQVLQDVFHYKNWIFIVKESVVITIFESKESRYTHLINM